MSYGLPVNKIKGRFNFSARILRTSECFRTSTRRRHAWASTSRFGLGWYELLFAIKRISHFCYLQSLQIQPPKKRFLPLSFFPLLVLIFLSLVGSERRQDVYSGGQGWSHCIDAGCLVLPGYMACGVDSSGEKGPTASAHIPRLFNNKPLGCRDHCFNIWTDWWQYAWHAKFLYSTHSGTTMNYFLDDRINKAEILFPGVACFMVAVCLGSAVHSSNAADNKEKLSGSSSAHTAMTRSIMDESGNKCNGGEDIENSLEKGIAHSKLTKPNAGTAEFLIELENTRSIKVFGSSTMLGMVIVIFSGICFSLFSPAFNLATNDQWHTLKKGVPHLVVYTAFFYFSISCFIVAIILNVIFLYRPILGLPRSCITDYLKDFNGRYWAFLAGFLCGFGNGFQFMGGQAAGYAAADAVQALPLVSTFWGIYLFGEYRKSSRRTYILLAGMLFMFVVAVAVLMASSGHRKS